MRGLGKKSAAAGAGGSFNLFFYAAVGLAVLCSVFWFPRSSFYKQKKDALVYLMHEAALSADLRLEEVFVEGRGRTSKSDLSAALNVTKGMPVTAIDIHAARERLLRLPWVKSVKVERRLPGFLFIDLVERTPIAVYQNKGLYKPVDENGQLIETSWKSMQGLPLLVGPSAYDKAPELIEFLSQEPDLFKRVKAGIRIGRRRWDILFDDIKKPITVRLPESDQAGAWSRLARRERNEGILKRKVTMIDLRLPDRISVRLEEELNKPAPRH